MPSRAEYVTKKYPKIKLKSLKDPSGNNKYLLWMAKQINEKQCTITKLNRLIEKFHQNKSRLVNKDLNGYTIGELESALSELVVSKRQQKREIKNEARIVYQNKNILVVRPKSAKAIALYGKGTQWCITNKNVYRNYLTRKNVFYVIITKSDDVNKYKKFCLVKNLGRSTNSIYNETDLHIGSLKTRGGKYFFNKTLVKSQEAAKAISMDFKSAKSDLDPFQQCRLGLCTKKNFDNCFNKLNEREKIKVVLLLDKKYYSNKSVHDFILNQINPFTFLTRRRTAGAYGSVRLRWLLFQKLAGELAAHKNDNVRLQTVSNVTLKHLPKFINDPNPKIRQMVASRIDKKFLPKFIDDPNPEIRKVAVSRIEKRFLPKFLDDKDKFIKYCAVQNMAVNQIIKYKNYPELLKDRAIRLAIAQRATGEAIYPFLTDKNNTIKHLALKRASLPLLKRFIKNKKKLTDKEKCSILFNLKKTKAHTLANYFLKDILKNAQKKI